MNKAITEGLLLMPPAFANGLDVWSSEDGTPGTITYDAVANAAYVPADADFGGALEIIKNSTVTKLRYMGETPMRPGMYLRVTARVKAIAGNLPSVRIAAWAGSVSLSHVSDLVETGPEVALTAYGEIVEVSAIVGTGARGGVDMAWGLGAVYGHFGIDLTGSNGGTVRIDDIVIEDVSSAFLSDSVGIIDVRDFGAVGDGVTECRAAFLAADSAANGRRLLVPKGSYSIGNDLTLNSEVQFEGTLSMADGDKLLLTRNYNLDTYVAAFGNEIAGFKKAIQALFNYTDHDSLDMCGRRIDTDETFDIQAIEGAKTSFETRRAIRNGQFNVMASSNWDTRVVTSSASFSVIQSSTLSNVANIANIEVGSIVTGTGVGREIYVRAVNVGAQSLTLSQPLWGAPANQTYTFTRHRYVLDFSGFSKLSQFQVQNVEFLCNGHASGIMLATDGLLFQLSECDLKRPKDRGLSSPGRACQGMQIDRCNFTSDESSDNAQDRDTIAFNMNANDMKLRDSRFQKFAHTAIMNGGGHMIVGNHVFQGDEQTAGPRFGGLVFTQSNVKSIITGNYIDNCSIEMTNEHDEAPDFNAEFSFGALTVTGNIFTTIDAASWFSFIVVKPYGPNHYIQGLSVTGNTFKTVNGYIDRIDKVDTTHADLDFSRMRNVVFTGNTFNGITQPVHNPVTLDFTQSTASTTWVIDPSAWLPFSGWSRTVDAITFKNALTDTAGAVVSDMPYVTNNYGSTSDQVRLTFPVATKGQVTVTTRMDTPV